MRTKKETEYKIGVDIGGTKIAAVLFDGKKVVDFYKLTTPKDNLNNFLVMLKALLDPILQKCEAENLKITSVGIGVPGTLDKEEKKITFAPNIPILNNVKLVDLIKDKLNISVPIKIDNDANCFVKAEANVGAGKKFNNVFGLVIGTGIGGGWSLNGEIYVGSNGFACEIGETIIDLNEKITLEQAYHKITQNNPQSLANEARLGDILAKKKFAEFGAYLGMALANMVNLIDPEIIVIGGGTSHSIDLFIDEAEKTMRNFLAPDNYKDLKIVKSKTSERAGAIGAALL